MGLPFIFIIGFGIDFVYSEILVPKPPAKITTFINFLFFFLNNFHKILFGQEKLFLISFLFYMKFLYQIDTRLDVSSKFKTDFHFINFFILFELSLEKFGLKKNFI